MDSLYNFGKVYPLANRAKRLETGDLRLRRGTYIQTGTFGRIQLSALDDVGQLDPTGTGIKKVGSIPPNGASTGFAYTSDTSSITWYWDGTNSSNLIVVRRADGLSQTVPPGSIKVSGLSANTTYYFLPYFAPNFGFNLGWVIGTVGSPKIALIQADLLDATNGPNYIMQQNLASREALTNGGMTAATTVSGSGGGHGGGGGSHGNGCVMQGTLIVPLGQDSWKEDLLPQRQWVRIETKDFQINCTLDHPLYHAEKGQITAAHVQKDDWLITDKGEQKVTTVGAFAHYGMKVRVRMKEGHLYWANHFLSHNKNSPVLP